MLCENCKIGEQKTIPGNGITEPPYIAVVRCPFDDKYYKLWSDECCHEKEREEEEKEREPR